MAARKGAGEKDAPEAAAEQNGNGEVTAAQQAAAAIGDQYVSYREDAGAIKNAEGSKYPEDGKLTGPIYDKLEPLLFKPTPPAYIEHTPASPGGYPAYATTGLKSAQIQIDRMNDVLGRRHWRTLLHYTQNGTLCKAVVVVGNDLQWARLDGEGELVPFTIVDTGDAKEVREADIVAMHEGWGGWKSKTLGDTFKSAETNALKRVLARFGPGADVYRVDYEEDILSVLKGEQPADQQFDRQAAGRATQQPPRPPQQRQQPAQTAVAAQTAAAAAARQAPAPQPQQQVTPEDAEAMLKTILEDEGATVQFGGQEVSLKELRNAVNEAMLALPERSRPNAAQRLTLIAPRKDDPQQLTDLLTRAQNAGAASES